MRRKGLEGTSGQRAFLKGGGQDEETGRFQSRGAPLGSCRLKQAIAEFAHLLLSLLCHGSPYPLSNVTLQYNAVPPLAHFHSARSETRLTERRKRDPLVAHGLTSQGKELHSNDKSVVNPKNALLSTLVYILQLLRCG